MSLFEKRSLVKAGRALSIGKQCGLLGLPRSSYYYEPAGESPYNLELMRLIDRRYHYHPYMGAPTMWAWLRYDKGHKVSRNRVDRLYYDKLGLRAVIPGPHTSKRAKDHAVFPYLLRGMDIVRPNQVWATDITYIPLLGGFMYLTAVMDLFSRFVLAWSLSNTMLSGWCVEMVSQAIDIYGKPGIINTDQGAQYTSSIFTEFVLGNDVRLSMDGKGRATDNAFIERLWRSVKYENIRFREYENGAMLANGLDEYFTSYNLERRHSSLDYRLPREVFFEGGQIHPPMQS